MILQGIKLIHSVHGLINSTPYFFTRHARCVCRKHLFSHNVQQRMLWSTGGITCKTTKLSHDVEHSVSPKCVYLNSRGYARQINRRKLDKDRSYNFDNILGKSELKKSWQQLPSSRDEFSEEPTYDFGGVNEYRRKRYPERSSEMNSRIRSDNFGKTPKAFDNGDAFRDLHANDKNGTMKKMQARLPRKPQAGISHESQNKSQHISSADFRDHKENLEELHLRIKTNQNEELDDWSETFGTLTENSASSLREIDDARYKDDEGEEDEFEKPYIRLSEYGRKHEPEWYFKEMEKLIDGGKLREAIHMYEVTMLKEDRVRPTTKVYSVLIGGLGRVGYTKLAFKLFRKMKQFGTEPDDPVFTGLFNACANSPWREDGLKRADGLFEWIKEKNYMLNAKSYNAAVKAYGMLGELQVAFRLMDEMVAAELRLDESSYAHLLIACISDKEAGFKHAIEVWRRMRKKKITPRLHHYNLLIRAMKECGVGDAEYAKNLLPVKKTGADNSVKLEKGDVNTKSVNKLDSKTEEFLQLKPLSISEIKDGDTAENKKALEGTKLQAATLPSMGGVRIRDLQKLPNLLNPRVRVDDSFSLGKVETPEDRLALLGGLPGLLNHMTKDKVVPNVKTFSQLVYVIPSTDTAEEELLTAMACLGVKKDTAFYNQIIDKRMSRNSFSGAKALAQEMAESNLVPDQKTFGCLAKGCINPQSALQLLEDMQSFGIKPNVWIWGTLMYASNMNFYYKLMLLKKMKEMGVAPNMEFLQCTEASIRKMNKHIVQMEKGEKAPRYVEDKGLRKGFKEFMLYYKAWIRKTNLHKQKHPWSDYRTDEQTGSEEAKA